MFNRTAVENHLLLRWNGPERVEMLRASWQLTTDLRYSPESTAKYGSLRFAGSSG